MVKKGREGPGQALIKQRSRASHPRSGASGEARQVLESITHVTDLEEVLEQAEHAGRIFSSLHPLPQVLAADDGTHGEFARLDASQKRVQQKQEEALHESSLTVPRRPKWHLRMSPEELDAIEREAFLEWRRGLVRLEDNEKLVVTPFEKNLDIWRQLWRVIERCHLIVTVVDARNPLFYRCPDLEAYIAEIDKNKGTILLLNKADLIPVLIRSKWAKYLKSQGIKFLFWSAKNVNTLLEKKGQVDVEETLPRTFSGRILEQNDTDLEEDVRILGREELLHRLQGEAEIIASHCQNSTQMSEDLDRKPGSNKPMSHQQTEPRDDNVSEKECVQPGVKHVAVGFVGYPNVGKSSTINALVGGKRTGVTSTPGKTKHFQTLIINDRLVLCDCPGLVFPSFTSSKSEMVASGVLPIDRMSDYRGPIQVVADQIPRAILENTYGISLPSPKNYEPQDRPPSAAEFLRTYALSRGYVISSGLPDETRSARQILKDYLNGKLLYCHTPPDANPQILELHNYEGSDDDSEEEDPANQGSENGGEGAEEELGFAEAQEGPFLVGQTISTSDLSKLDGIFRDLEAPVVRGGSHARVTSSHKMRKKTPRKKDRSWRAKDDDHNEMHSIRGVPKPVSYGASRLGQVS